MWGLVALGAIALYYYANKRTYDAKVYRNLLNDLNGLGKIDRDRSGKINRGFFALVLTIQLKTEAMLKVEFIK